MKMDKLGVYFIVEIVPNMGIIPKTPQGSSTPFCFA